MTNHAFWCNVVPCECGATEYLPMKQHLTCNKPDRHNPKLTCGYPLPCLHHTVTITSKNITIPSQSPAHYCKRKLKQIQNALYRKKGL